jgi:CPA1 family monovalent cation:H+ antiporter
MPNGSPFPARHLAIFLASSVIVVSLLLASIALPALLRGLEVPEEPQDTPCNADQARHESMLAAIAALDRARLELADRPGGDLAAREARERAIDHVLRVYQHRLPQAGNGDGEAEPATKAARRVEREIRVLALNAERDSVLRLARRMQISDETARRLLRNIDLLEARYRPD